MLSESEKRLRRPAGARVMGLLWGNSGMKDLAVWVNTTGRINAAQWSSERTAGVGWRERGSWDDAVVEGGPHLRSATKGRKVPTVEEGVEQ